MNEAKLFDKKRLDAIKKKLLERKKELEAELAEIYKEEQTPEQLYDVGDRVQSLSLENLRISLQDAEIDEYNRIRQALQMIEDGIYGICVDCGKPISDKRLKLYPNATRCLICQEAAEEQRAG